MTDLSSLSNEELLALRDRMARPTVPAAPAFKPVSEMTNEELLAARAKLAGGLREQVQAFAGNALDGIPIAGPYLKAGVERARAGVDSLMNDTPFSQELAEARASAETNTANHPWTATAGQLTGGVLGTVPMVAAAPAAFGVGGSSLLSASAAAAVSGGFIGGADQAVRSGGDATAALKGAGVGALMGGGAVPAGRLIGRGTSALYGRARGWASAPDNALSGIAPRAVDYATSEIANPAQQAALQQKLQQLGPEGMLADVSGGWLGMARGAAGRPGERDGILEPLLTRDAARNQRLAGDLDASLGPAPIPSRIEASLAEGRRNLAPAYGEVFEGERAVNTQPIADSLDTLAVELRGPAQKAVLDVRRMLNITGEKELDPSPRTLFQVRQAIDGLMAGESNPKVIAQLAAARQQVDSTVAAAIPGIKDVDAAYAELAGQSEGLERGAMILGNGKTAIRPQELAAEFSASALPRGNMIGPSAAPFRLQQGTRAELDRIVGTNANDPQALKRTMLTEGDWNRDKLRTVFGQEKADAAMNAVDREVTFYQTAGKVTAGSDTDMSKRFGDFLDDVAKPNRVPADTTLTGAGLRGVQKVAQAMMKTRSDEKALRFASQLGRLAVAQGTHRDEIVAALIEASRKQDRVQPVSRAVEQVTNAMVRAGGLQVANGTR
jgi:hypothetical protein